MPTTYPARERVDLSGRWSATPLARTELTEDGLSERTDDLPGVTGLPVPGNWHDHGLAGFHGRVAYARELPPLAGDGWWLCCDGVDYFAEVRVDGVRLAWHEGACDGFAVPLPAGAERLEIVVDAPREQLGTVWPFRKRQLKGVLTQWDPLEPFQDTTGGIWGAVRAERRPPEHVTAVTTTPYLVPRIAVEEGAYVEAPGRDARVLVEVEAHAAAAGEASLSVTLCGVRAERVVSLPAGASRHRIALTVPDPELWWPWDRGEPVLHELAVRLGQDEVRRRVGLREVAFDEATGELRVNGERVAVRGSNLFAEKWLARYGAERARADAALARDANLNAVRVVVHVATDELYDACDEAGLLVWQDLPLQWDYRISDELVTEAADQAERIVSRLHDHPSIVIWSCHNEPFPADRKHYAAALLRAVRRVDGNRPVHAASDFAEHAYPGWFLGHVRDYGRPPQLPYVTEFGAQALPSAAEVRAMGGTAWPPSGAEWSRLLAEPTPLFDVAGVPLGGSLEELVEASQRYQAELVRTAVESYRVRGMSFFHFQLVDAWPNVSWSVVSYDRVPKLGHAALAHACTPLLVGAELTRDVLSDAWDSRRFPPLSSVWVVNDTTEALPGARWVAMLGGTEIAAGGLDVAPLAVTHWHPPAQRWPSWQPPALDPGEHEIEIALYDATGRQRARNAYRVRQVRHGLGLEPPA